MIKRRNKYMTDWRYPNYFEDGGGLYGRPDTSLGLTTQQMLQRDGQQMLDYGKQLADQKNQQMMQDFNKSQNFQNTIGKIGGALGTAGPAIENMVNTFNDPNAKAADKWAAALGIPELANVWKADTSKGDALEKSYAERLNNFKNSYIQDSNDTNGAFSAISSNNHVNLINPTFKRLGVKDFKGNWGSSILKSIGQGAASGSIGGAWGAAGGAVTGLFGSLFGRIGARKRAKRALEEHNRRMDALSTYAINANNEALKQQQISNQMSLMNGLANQRTRELSNIRAFGGNINLYSDGEELFVPSENKNIKAMGGNLYTDLSPNMMSLWNDKQNIDKQKVMNQQMNFGLDNSFNQKLNMFDYGGDLNPTDPPEEWEEPSTLFSNAYNYINNRILGDDITMDNDTATFKRGSTNFYQIQGGDDPTKYVYGSRNRNQPINHDKILNGSLTSLNEFYPYSEIKNEKPKHSTNKDTARYIGYDKNGHFKQGTIKDFEEGDVLTEVPYVENVSSFNSDDLVRSNSNRMYKRPTLSTDKGKTDIGVETKDDTSKYGDVSGGKLLLTDENGNYRIISGSVDRLKEEFNKTKKDFGANKLTVIQLDNGTFNRGYNPVNGSTSKKDLVNYDTQNNKGGHFMYAYDYNPDYNADYNAISNEPNNVNTPKPTRDLSLLEDGQNFLNKGQRQTTNYNPISFPYNPTSEDLAYENDMYNGSNKNTHSKLSDKKSNTSSSVPNLLMSDWNPSFYLYNEDKSRNGQTYDSRVDNKDSRNDTTTTSDTTITSNTGAIFHQNPDGSWSDETGKINISDKEIKEQVKLGNGTINNSNNTTSRRNNSNMTESQKNYYNKKRQSYAEFNKDMGFLNKDDVKRFQEAYNREHEDKLKVDGLTGDKTIKAYQRWVNELNKDNKDKETLKIDGFYGKKSKDANNSDIANRMLNNEEQNNKFDNVTINTDANGYVEDYSTPQTKEPNTYEQEKYEDLYGNDYDNIDQNKQDYYNNYPYAYGGNLNRFDYGGAMNGMNIPTNMQYYENGGTHEENPNGGIQVGQDQQGNPNLVEEGEFRYGDYIFSDRIPVDYSILSDFNAGKSKGSRNTKNNPTYAELAKKTADKYKDLNDEISKNSLNKQLERLQQSQEAQKFKEQQDQQYADYKSALKNPTQGNPMYGSMKYSGLGNANQGVNEGSDMNMAAMDNSDLSNVNRSGNPMMAAYGGNLFGDGGKTRRVMHGKVITNSINPYGNQQLGVIDSNNDINGYGLPIKGTQYLTYTGLVDYPTRDNNEPSIYDLNLPKTQTYGQYDYNTVNQAKNQNSVPSDYVGVSNEWNDFGNSQDNRIFGRPELRNNPSGIDLSRTYPYLNNSAAQKQQILVNNGYNIGNTGPNGDGVDNVWGKKSQTAWNDFINNKYGSAQNNQASPTNNSNISKSNSSYEKRVYNKSGVEHERNGVDQYKEETGVGNKFANTGQNPQNALIYNHDLNKPAAGIADTTRTNVPMYSDFGYWANMGKGLMPNMMDWQNKTNWRFDPNWKPETNLEALALRAGAKRTSDHIGNYIAPHYMDLERMNNAAQAQTASNARNILNVSNGRGQAASALAANDYNGQIGIGNNYMTADQYNADQDFKTAEFNRGTDQYNATANNDMFKDNLNADLQKQQAQLNAFAQTMQSRSQKEQYKDRVDREAMNNRASNLGAMFDNMTNVISDNALYNRGLNEMNTKQNQRYYLDKKNGWTYKGGNTVSDEVNDFIANNNVRLTPEEFREISTRLSNDPNDKASVMSIVNNRLNQQRKEDELDFSKRNSELLSKYDKYMDFFNNEGSDYLNEESRDEIANARREYENAIANAGSIEEKNKAYFIYKNKIDTIESKYNRYNSDWASKRNIAEQEYVRNLSPEEKEEYYRRYGVKPIVSAYGGRIKQRGYMDI